MTDDDRCCGTGTCLIDAQGRCWCGQQWDGERMCHPNQLASSAQPASQPSKTDADEDFVPV